MTKAFPVGNISHQTRCAENFLNHYKQQKGFFIILHYLYKLLDLLGTQHFDPETLMQSFFF